MPQENPLLFFVINPISGGREKHDWEKAIKQYFHDKPYRTEFYVLRGKNDKASIKHYINTIKPEKIIAVGGDGTVKLLGELLYNTNIPLGILPAGSANGMAAELGITNIIEDALNIIITGKQKIIDVIRLNHQQLCLHLSDIGLNAEMIKYFEQHPSRGKISYARFMLKAIWQKKQFNIELLHEGETVYRKAYMVVIANASKYGTGASINPGGDVSDGIFEVVILKKLSVRELMKMLLKRRSFNPSKTEIFTATAVTIKSGTPADFQIDGEYIGKTTEVTASLERNKLTVIIPA